MSSNFFASIIKLLPHDSVNTNSSHIWFTENKGQWDSKILFEGKFYGGKVFLLADEFSYLFSPKEGLKSIHHKLNNVNGYDTLLTFHSIKMKFLNANPNCQITQLDSNSFYENYFLGKESKKWATHVKSYKKIIYNQFYKNIDLQALSSKNNFRYDFIVHPNANVSDISINWQGDDGLKIQEGKLIIKTAVGDVYQSIPYAYQMINGEKIKIACEYLLENSILKFRISESYNPKLDLIIDPTLVFASYTGSLSDNFGMTATYDNAGNAYTAGICFGNQYPTTVGAFQVNFASSGSGTPNFVDISISKFNTSGSALIYSTYLGGAGDEGPESIVVDNSNELVVFGRSNSVNYPVTAGVFQNSLAGAYDFIVTKFNSSGTALIASTYLGGSLNDGLNAIFYNYEDGLRGSVLVDNNNNIFLGGNTESTNFPVTTGCLQSILNGSQDAVVVKFDPLLTNPIFSTYLGGTNRDAVYNITLNLNNELYVCGGTQSADFPTTPGSLNPNSLGGIDGFACLLSNSGSSLVSSTYIGTAAYNQAFFYSN